MDTATDLSCPPLALARHPDDPATQAFAGIIVAALLPLDTKENEAPIGETIEGEA